MNCPRIEPIEPADIQVGDVVQRESRLADGTETLVRGRVVEKDDLGRVRISDIWSGNRANSTVLWFLIERPDPDAALVEAMARAAFESADFVTPGWGQASDSARRRHLRRQRAALAALREGWTLVPKSDACLHESWEADFKSRRCSDCGIWLADETGLR